MFQRIRQKIHNIDKRGWKVNKHTNKKDVKPSEGTQSESRVMNTESQQKPDEGLDKTNK